MGEAETELERGTSLDAVPVVLTDVAAAAAAPVVAEEAAALEAARADLESSATYAAVAELFGALADPSRARIVHLLMEHEWSTRAIAAITGASEPASSQHLRVLRGLHLVQSRRVGRWVYYRLDDAHVASLMRTSLAHLGEAGDGARPADVAELPAVPAVGGAGIAGMNDFNDMSDLNDMNDVSLIEGIEAV